MASSDQEPVCIFHVGGAEPALNQRQPGYEFSSGSP